MTNELYRQCLLKEIGGWESGDIKWTGAEITCWLPDDDRLHEGKAITLKEMPERHWCIIQISSIRMPKQGLHKPWHVGGL